ncbi:MAG: peptidoglycan DD-metalloendopeptidase family protein [Bacilli bacterium]|nr:peptidoglycan DD-metalloendopeptidase family protein [Bacilli bacterium]
MNIKKIILFCLVFFVAFPLVINTYATAKTTTLADLRAKLAALEKEDLENKNNIKKTESQIATIKSEINQIYIDMDNIEKEMIQKTAEIGQLTTEIASKDAETKELMHFLQISSNGSVYLEYIVGAATLTDFIYRLSVVEQVTKYNADLIDSMNNKIAENEAKKIELNNKTQELASKKVEFNNKVASLGKEKTSLYEYDRSLADEMKTSREVIAMYKNAGCSETEDINICANRLLPPDTRFWRPLNQGIVTSEYGYRTHPITGVWKMHDGIDLSNSDKSNTKVYAAAAGKVAKVGYDSSMGNYVIIHHNISGTNYTTQYLHLKTGSILVGSGTLVSKDTILATMGTTGSSTGVHLHFSVAKGLRYKDYFTYSAFVAKTINPRLSVNFPSGIGRYWYNRYNKYN